MDPSKAFPVDFAALNRVTAAAVAYWFGMLTMAGALTYKWIVGGLDRPVYWVVLASWTFMLGPGVAIPVMRRVPVRWLNVPAGERFLHRMLGVGAFAWLLQHSGYNRRFVHPQWGFSINREGLPFRAMAARGGVRAHGACMVIHLVLSVLALVTGHTWSALGILLPGMLVHLYPVLLQRAILLRLQPLLDKAGARRPISH